VVERNQRGEDVPFEEFKETFHSRVTGIGHVLPMLEPWDSPVRIMQDSCKGFIPCTWCSTLTFISYLLYRQGYLTRVWCIFEIFTAMMNDNVKVTIVMPPCEKEKMTRTILDVNNGVDQLFDVLAKTKVENAQASMPEDVNQILKILRDGPGFHFANSKVNTYIRKWVSDTVNEVVRSRKQDLSLQGSAATEKERAHFSTFCFGVGNLLHRNGEHDAALEKFQEAAKILEELVGPLHPSAGIMYTSIGLALDSLGRHHEALEAHESALAVNQELFGEKDPRTASNFNNIGMLHADLGDYNKALTFLYKTRDIRIATLDSKEDKATVEDKKDAALIHNNIGSVLEKQGDFQGALGNFRRCLAIQKDILDEDSIEFAMTYNNIGYALLCLGRVDEALIDCHKALAIRERILGSDHPDTTVSRWVLVYYRFGQLRSWLLANIHSLLFCQEQRCRSLWCQG
jgi:tetratricopeptide (TPR) repeat protein